MVCYCFSKSPTSSLGPGCASKHPFRLWWKLAQPVPKSKNIPPDSRFTKTSFDPPSLPRSTPGPGRPSRGSFLLGRKSFQSAPVRSPPAEPESCLCLARQHQARWGRTAADGQRSRRRGSSRMERGRSSSRFQPTIFRPNLSKLGCSSGRRQTCTNPNPSGRLLRSAVAHSVAGRIQTAEN